MKKIIYRKFLSDCLIFFIITLLSTSVIIWVFQAVNYLDIIIDDGRDYHIYFKYTLLNFPKIISKILPFAFFFSFTYVIAKYELNNELLIYWNFGVNKIHFVNFFLLFFIILFILKILLSAFIVPKSQSLARSVIRTSDFKNIDNLIKIKKFNATLNDLTIYTESKDKIGNYNNIYIKENTSENNFQIIYAKKGILKNINKNTILELYDGENTSFINNKITNFSFSKSEFNLNSFSTNTIIVRKTQEHSTLELLACAESLTLNKKKYDKLLSNFHNCSFSNLQNIFAELFKRLITPLYLPTLMLIALLLIIKSKEKINYSKYRFIIFMIGLFVIIFSESTLRFVNTSLNNNLFLILIPIFSTVVLYFYIYLNLKFTKKYENLY